MVNICFEENNSKKGKFSNYGKNSIIQFSG